MKAKCRDSLTHKRTTVKSSRSDRNRFSSSPQTKKSSSKLFLVYVDFQQVNIGLIFTSYVLSGTSREIGYNNELER